MADVALKALPFKEAIDYFRAKGYKTTFDHRDMEAEAHSYAFTVAKAMRSDILQDIRQSVDSALANGDTFNTFKDSLKPTLQDKGWWGVQEMVDPATGEKKEVQLGSSRRLRTIFDTNLRTAYATGRWEQVQRTKKTMPYLRYVAVMDDRTRPEHRAWNNVVKPVDDPFWEQHYPPNGYNCRCSVQQLAQEDIDDMGLEVTKYDPSGPDRAYLNKRTGQIVKAPQGVDPSFAYNPGVSRMKAITPPPLDQPLDVPYSGDPAKVPLPRAQAAPRKLILPPETSNEDCVRAFLKEFGADIGAPKVFNDVTGEPVTISDDLFRAPNGNWKMAKRSRKEYLLLLAQTIMRPDEIWNTWEEYPKGRFSLLRRYIARFSVEGQQAPGFALFDTKPTGWVGVTTFKPDEASYIKQQRKGTLVYRRDK